MIESVSPTIEPLLRRKIFSTQDEAIRELLREYTLRQVTALQRGVARFERKYGMSFPHFSQYLHERSALLTTDELTAEQRQTLGRAIMREEDDWLEWKAAQELLDSWLGLSQEMAA